MNSTTVVDMRQFVRAKNGEAFTSSQSVSDAFGKQHKDVLRKIETVGCSAEFRERNFTLTHETLMSGAVRRQTPIVEMTKDGFMFLVMGFTGKKADAIKEGYIAAFNWMAEQLGINSSDAVRSLIDGVELATLKAVMQDKAKEVAPEKKVSFLHTMHHRLHTRFNVPRTELIQREHFADACNFVAAYALDGEWLPKQEGINIEGKRFDRFLVSFDENGKQQISIVPREACVMTVPQMIKAMLTPGDLPVATDEMFEFAQAALTNLQMRSEHQTFQLRKARAVA